MGQRLHAHGVQRVQRRFGAHPWASSRAAVFLALPGGRPAPSRALRYVAPLIMSAMSLPPSMRRHRPSLAAVIVPDRASPVAQQGQKPPDAMGGWGAGVERQRARPWAGPGRFQAQGQRATSLPQQCIAGQAQLLEPPVAVGAGVGESVGGAPPSHRPPGRRQWSGSAPASPAGRTSYTCRRPSGWTETRSATGQPGRWRGAASGLAGRPEPPDHGQSGDQGKRWTGLVRAGWAPARRRPAARAAPPGWCADPGVAPGPPAGPASAGEERRRREFGGRPGTAVISTPRTASQRSTVARASGDRTSAPPINPPAIRRAARVRRNHGARAGRADHAVHRGGGRPRTRLGRAPRGIQGPRRSLSARASWASVGRWGGRHSAIGQTSPQLIIQGAALVGQAAAQAREGTGEARLDRAAAAAQGDGHLLLREIQEVAVGDDQVILGAQRGQGAQQRLVAFAAQDQRLRGRWARPGRRAATCRARAARRPSATRRLRASLATMRSSQGRKEPLA